MNMRLFSPKLTDSHDKILVELESHERLRETPEGGVTQSRVSLGLPPERRGSSEWDGEGFHFKGGGGESETNWWRHGAS